MQKRLILFLFVILSATLTTSAQLKETGPDFFGYVKALHQTDLTAGQGQFSVIHARFGVKGNLNQNVSYRIFTDFNRLLGANVDNSGKLNLRSILLDAFFKMQLTNRLSFALGQYKVPFSTSNLRSPVTMMFVNRPLTTSVTPSLRDVGLTFYYTNKDQVPLDFALGVFNGSGENSYETDKTMNYAARVMVKPIEELGLSANYYGGKLNNFAVSIFDFGAHAKIKNLLLDGEYASRNTDLNNAGTLTSAAFFVYAGYEIPTDFWVVNSITPLLRFDSFDPSTSVNDDQLTRITAGLNFGLSDKNVTGIRLNYENRDSKAAGFNDNDYFYVSFQVLF